MMKFRDVYADARGPSGRARGRERGVGAALQDQKRPTCDAGRPVPAPLLDRRDAAGSERPVGRDVARRPAAVPLRDFVQLEDVASEAVPRAPGMTGLWQVQAGRPEFDDLVRLDFYYLENWSIWLDISILAKTLPAVLARRGAY